MRTHTQSAHSSKKNTRTHPPTYTCPPTHTRTTGLQFHPRVTRARSVPGVPPLLGVRILLRPHPVWRMGRKGCLELHPLRGPGVLVLSDHPPTPPPPQHPTTTPTPTPYPLFSSGLFSCLRHSLFPCGVQRTTRMREEHPRRCEDEADIQTPIQFAPEAQHTSLPFTRAPIFFLSARTPD